MLWQENFPISLGRGLGGASSHLGSRSTTPEFYFFSLFSYFFNTSDSIFLFLLTCKTGTLGADNIGGNFV